MIEMDTKKKGQLGKAGPTEQKKIYSLSRLNVLMHFAQRFFCTSRPFSKMVVR
jgi:hypothetical protein